MRCARGICRAFRSLASQVMRGIQESMWEEEGPYSKRPANKMFVEWVELAGWLR